MKLERKRGRFFQMHETGRLHALEGMPLATFAQRVAGYFIDLFLALLLWAPLEFSWRRYFLHQTHIDLKWDFHEFGNIAVMLLYWAALRTISETNGHWANSWWALAPSR